MQHVRRTARIATIATAALLSVVAKPAAADSFVNFESGHVRPLALSPDGSKLFAVNTPDNRLEIYTVSAAGLTLADEVPVGLEPVAVAVRTNTEAWVVNHLSDSVSVVAFDASAGLWRVKRTLLTCDEPRDIVFAGTGGNRAFVTTARRGQNCPVAANLTTAGTGRAVVQVFDGANLDATLGGTPLANIVLFGDTPRALARTPDGSQVFAAIFESGNQTTTITQTVVQANGGLPPPPAGATPGAPSTGLIVKFNGTNWVDEINRSWNAQVPFNLPDRDVFIIDANAAALVGGTSSVTGVGTVIFNMAVRPNAANQLYVTNLDARNQVRFESRIPGDALGRGVQGHIAESRITVINGTTPTPHHLNPHIDYTCTPPTCTPPASEAEASIAFPTDLVFSERRPSRLRRRPRLREDRHLRCRRSRGRNDRRRHQDAGGRRRRSERPRARRGAQPALRDEPVHARHLDREQRQQPGDGRRDRRRPAALRPGAAGGPRRAPVPVRRAHHVGPRRLGLRELPHLRRLRQPGLGSERSVRPGAARTTIRSA